MHFMLEYILIQVSIVQFIFYSEVMNINYAIL